MVESELMSDFKNFLRGNFTQDIESEEDVIKEILDEESKDYLIYATKFISTFLNLDISIESKINIIIENTALYYQDQNQYLMLIKDILNCINKKLEK
ncbi:MAG: hypothetical protein ACRC7R_09125 [Sarcina sp.]